MIFKIINPLNLDLWNENLHRAETAIEKGDYSLGRGLAESILRQLEKERESMDYIRKALRQTLCSAVQNDPMLLYNVLQKISFAAALRTTICVRLPAQGPSTSREGAMLWRQQWSIGIVEGPP